MSEDLVERLILRLGEYLIRSDEPVMCDALLVFGHWDLKIPQYAASLMRNGIAPIAIISGSRGKFTAAQTEPEATVFRRAMEELGTPHTHILEERKAAHTGENITFALDLAAGLGLNLHTWGLVTRGLQSRRTYLTFKNLSDLTAVSLPPPDTLTADHYGNRLENLTRLVEEVEKMSRYAQRGILDAPPKDEVSSVLAEAKSLLSWTSGES